MAELDSIFSDDWGEDHRSGLVAVVGAPNVGKSTLVNALLGQKIAITTPKPQTTRARQLGIYTGPEAQILFIDTPGIHAPRSRFGEYMVDAAHDALKDADVILWVMDASRAPAGEDGRIAELLPKITPKTPVALVLNKIDLVEPTRDLSAQRALCQSSCVILASALKATRLDEILACLVPFLPLGPRYYPADQASDANLRFLAAELIREQIILLTSDEIPHSAAVEITRFREKPDRVLIEATIHVERNSQKGIVIGRRGGMIKRIGSQARAELEKQLGARVRLETRVKVLKNWRGNEDLMRRVGYVPPRRKRK